MPGRCKDDTHQLQIIVQHPHQKFTASAREFLGNFQLIATIAKKSEGQKYLPCMKYTFSQIIHCPSQRIYTTGPLCLLLKVLNH